MGTGTKMETETWKCFDPNDYPPTNKQYLFAYSLTCYVSDSIQYDLGWFDDFDCGDDIKIYLRSLDRSLIHSDFKKLFWREIPRCGG